MDRLIDEIVEVRVTDAVAAASATPVNTAAVLGVSTKTDTLVVYKNEVATKCDGDLAKVAASFFAENNPGKLVCIPTTSEDLVGSNIKSLLDAAISLGKDASSPIQRDVDFYHVIIRLGDSVEASAAIEIVKALDSWCADNFRLGHVEVKSLELAGSIVKGLGKKLSRVALYSHNDNEGTSLAAAIVADRCASDPARGTWAHKTLVGVTPDAIGQSDLKDVQDHGINVYCKVAGVARTFFGSIIGQNNAFIDEVVKKDWLKFRTQEAVFNILGSANNGDGVDYNDAGIIAIAAAINNIFTIAADNDHRYIMPDSFDVQVPKYADISRDDKEQRNLPDVKVTFAIQASINTVKYIELQVVSA